MLSRQRVLLAILAKAGGRATRLQVTKWAFLLREETPSRGGSAFFQFVPYRYGPFSFCLYQEAESLTRNGLMRAVDARRWELSKSGEVVAQQLPPVVADDVRRVMAKYGGAGAKELMSDVYDRYRWFTVNSVHDARMQKPAAEPAVYTAGYEGLLVDGFLDGLLRAGMRLLVDVRHNPVSRRYGFHKSTLERLCGHVGVEYRHFPELGICSSERQDIESPHRRRAQLDRYEFEILPSQSRFVEKVGELLREKPGALVCMESDHECCHRSRLARAVSGLTGLKVRHLEFAP